MSAPFHPPTRGQDYYFGIPILQSGSEQGQQFFGSVLQALGSQEKRQEEQRVAEMAAARLEQYGPQGSYWGEQIRKDPRAALMLAEQYGGFGEIEAQLAAAQAQGASRAAMERALQADGNAGLSPAEVEIFRQGGPEALKNFRDAVRPKSEGPTNYTTDEGVFIRDPSVPGGYRNVGKPKQSGGMQVYDSAGNLIVSTGGHGLTNTTRSKIEGKQVDAQAAISRLDRIASSFDPNFQTFGTKAQMRVLQMVSSIGGPDALKPEDRARLESFSRFRVSAYQHMSDILHELSGAAISPAEEVRLRQQLPNPGTGLFDGDDPVTFKAKLDEVSDSVRRSIELYQRMGGAGESSPAPIPNAESSGPRPAAAGATPARPPKPSPMVNGKRVEWQWDPDQGDWYYED